MPPRVVRRRLNRIVEVIHTEWNDAADLARLSAADQGLLWGVQILNPSIYTD